MLEEALGGSPAHSPILRFTEKLVPANAGGPRGRSALQPYLKVIGDVRGKKVLLIDDIYTTGGSLRASIDVIEAAGGSVTAGIVCGYTVSDSQRPPFGAQFIDLAADDILSENAASG